MLEAINLKKAYGDMEALKGLDLTVNSGDVYCLLGANGAGKTTTINLFLNFIEPTGGTAKVCGIDVTEQPLETKKLLAYIPEQVMLYGNLTAMENLRYFAQLGGHVDAAASADFSLTDNIRDRIRVGQDGCDTAEDFPNDDLDLGCGRIVRVLNFQGLVH